MRYLIATSTGLFVFGAVQVVCFWPLFNPIRNNVAIGINAIRGLGL